jgi:hypothetical protein
MRLFFVKHTNGQVTYANWPIKETGGESYEFNVKDSELEAVIQGAKDWHIEDGKLSLVNSTRKAQAEAAKAQTDGEKQAVAELKKRFEKGEGTPEEIQKALSKLL